MNDNRAGPDRAPRTQAVLNRSRASAAETGAASARTRLLRVRGPAPGGPSPRRRAAPVGSRGPDGPREQVGRCLAPQMLGAKRRSDDGAGTGSARARLPVSAGVGLALAGRRDRHRQPRGDRGREPGSGANLPFESRCERGVAARDGRSNSGSGVHRERAGQRSPAARPVRRYGRVALDRDAARRSPPGDARGGPPGARARRC